MRWWAVLTVAGLVVGITVPAQAHLEMRTPTPRHDGSAQKSGPCGMAGSTRGSEVTVFQPGERVEIVWDETVNHPAHYRIAFDDDGDNDFTDPPCETHCDDRADPLPPTFTLYADPTVMLDDIEDGNRATGRAQITLPDIECENCTLQLIQVMYDKRPITAGGNDIYYTCADIALRREPASSDGGSPPVTDASVAQDAGSRDAGTVAAGDASRTTDSGATERTIGGSCSISADEAPVSTMLVALFLWLHRRSARRSP